MFINKVKDYHDTMVAVSISIGIAIICCFLFFLWTDPGPYAVLKEDVVRHGAAHWEVDASGKTTFVWNK